MNRDVFSKKDCRLVVGKKGLWLVLYLDYLAKENGVPLEMDVEMPSLPLPPPPLQSSVNPYAMGPNNMGMMPPPQMRNQFTPGMAPMNMYA